MHFTVDASPALTEDVRELARDVGDERAVQEEGARETTMVGRFGARSTVHEGQTVEVAVATGALHFFDPETGDGTRAPGISVEVVPRAGRARGTTAVFSSPSGDCRSGRPT